MSVHPPDEVVAVAHRVGPSPQPLPGGGGRSIATLSGSPPVFSVLVPTRDEADNVGPLLQRLLPVLDSCGVPGEVLFLDDSDDATPQAIADAVEALRPAGGRAPTVRVLHRSPDQRERGLGGALEAGFARARGDVVVVLDGDLQHPPEVLPALLACFADPEVDLAIGSRFVPGGDAGGLAGPTRRMASRLARTAAQVVVPPARGLSDPCGGLFAVRRTVLVGASLRTHGSKILLEVLARTPWRVAIEVPYRFEERRAGTSTLDSAEVCRFARHVLLLSTSRSSVLSSPGPRRAAVRRTPAPLAGVPRDGGRAEPTGVLVPSEGDQGGRPAPPTAPSSAGPQQAASTRQTSWWVAAALVLFFAAGQAVWILTGARGPFLDEGTYATAGWRTLRGHGIADGYLSWFAGSLLWPVISGAAYQVGGLVASRLVAAAMVTLGTVAAIAATRTLYGHRAAAWGAAVLVGSAPLLALGHLAVYDTVSLAGVGVALWAVVRLNRQDHRRWLLVLVPALVVAVLGKYPVVFLVPPLLLLLLVLRGRRRGVVDVLVVVFLCGAAGLAYYLPWRYQLSQFIGWRTANDPTFGVTRAMIALEQAYLLAPVLLLALIGLTAARRARPPVAAALVLTTSALVFPVYHLLNGSGVSATKHAAFGLLLASPVAGLALDRATRRWRLLTVPATVGVLAALTVADLGLARTLDQGWVDVRPATTYLASHAHPGDTFMMSNSWPLLPALYRAGVVVRPTQVVDGWAVGQGLAPGDWCAADWVVDEEGGTGWDDRQRAAIAACGTFERVVDAPTAMTALGSDLRYVHWQASTVLWRNTAAPQKRS